MVKPSVFKKLVLAWLLLFFLKSIELIFCVVGVCNFGVEDLKRALATVRCHGLENGMAMWLVYTQMAMICERLTCIGHEDCLKPNLLQSSVAWD